MYTPVIGLEVHIQSKTKSKMFCSCSSSYFGKDPNVNICPVCTGMPGALPVINSKAIDNCIKLSLALNCEINTKTKFDRKNYYYPDLPKGYQISQYDMPIGKNGYLGIEVNSDEERIRIRRVHQEEDTAKSLHGVDVSEEGAVNYTNIDFNKSGVALIEVVTEPDFTSTKEVNEFAKSLQRIIRYLDVSDADMEKGQMRFELNISLRKVGVKELPNYKVEVKNISSISILEKVINYEIKRQTQILERNELPIQETRGIEDNTGETFSQRFKEEADDYRYFPEPDLPVLNIDENQIQRIKKEIVELPLDKKNRFIKEYGIYSDIAKQISNDKDTAEWFEKTSKLILSKKNDNSLIVTLSNFLVGDIEAMCKKHSLNINSMKLTSQNMADAIILMSENKISAGVVKKIIEEFVVQESDVNEYVEKNGLNQISSADELEGIIAQVIKENEDIVQSFKNGKLNAKSALIGKIMNKTKGKANPKESDRILTKLLEQKI